MCERTKGGYGGGDSFRTAAVVMSCVRTSRVRLRVSLLLLLLLVTAISAATIGNGGASNDCCRCCCCCCDRVVPVVKDGTTKAVVAEVAAARMIIETREDMQRNDFILRFVVVVDLSFGPYSKQALEEEKKKKRQLCLPGSMDCTRPCKSKSNRLIRCLLSCFDFNLLPDLSLAADGPDSRRTNDENLFFAWFFEHPVT